MMKKKIYLAGGWFSPEQEEEHTRIYNLIKDEYDVFNPKLASLVKPDSTQDEMTQTFLGNLEAIRNADIVLVITDRKDIGTIWEAGYAYANQKPIVYYAETLGNKPFNLMLAKTGRVVINEIQLLFELADEDNYKFTAVHDYDGVIE
ncbi:MAG TPA: nucleoside 2-deoxyribosyltransferase [Fervidobacterium sp.]|nr:nucleoside 2-deoxyribosyltransferase [Fervidobacterium sp.]